MIRIIFTLILFLCSAELFAQKEANVWYFGERAGLDFNNGSPVALSNGQLSTGEGCATVSDKNGNLLFYTNGENVWNRNHQVMPGGTGLMGGFSSTQSAVVIPFPGDDSRYYIFTTAQEKTSYGLRYSIVDMKSANGLGDITTKNVLLLNNVYEKVSAVKKLNCPDYWVVTKKWDSDEYDSYLVSAAGIANPVVSKTGNFTGGPSEYSRGQMKFSPDGTKMAAAYNINYDFFELMDFNQATGSLTNPIKLTPNPPPTETFSVGAYGVEFSPNSQLLYVAASYLFSTPRLFTIYQYNVSYSNAAQIIASKKLINATEFTGGMQLGPDKKIYIATYDNYLNAINSPDVEGTGCGFITKAVLLTGSSRGSLPTFIQSYFTDPIIATGNCEFQNINFSIQQKSDIATVVWDFGDPASGPDNSSTSSTPLHIYSKEGTYKVKLVFLRNGGCIPDTVYKTVYAGPFKLYLGNDTILCKGDTLQLSVNISNAKYLWNDGSTQNSIKTADGGTSWVMATLNSCTASDSINISIQDPPSFSLGNDTAICSNSQIVLSPVPAPVNARYQWSTGSASSQLTSSQPGTYWLTIFNNAGCHNTDTINISQITLPEFNLGPDTVLCQTNLRLNAAVNGAGQYTWSSGESTPSINVNRTGVYWADVTKNGCVYRDSIKVQFNSFPVVNLGNDTTLCQGQTLWLDAGNQGAQYQWQDNGNQQTYLVNKPGVYSVKVTSGNCPTLDSIHVSFNLKPTVTLGPDISICAGQVMTLKPTVQNGNNIIYSWQDGSTFPAYSVKNPGIYSLTVSNQCGNFTDTLLVTKGVCKLFVPNAFTPNGDGINDDFKPSYGENISKYKMEIFNRWGQKIFESLDISKGWDGKFKNQLQPNDVYIWLMRFHVAGEIEDQVLKGPVMLVR